jgi:AcrR family transcriptional regulator
MPRETFFNLDIEKREKILSAATKEFTDNQLHKSRVSNIIKKAGIPRGSFYQYFEDLDDLYYYVIDDAFDKIFYEGYKNTELTNDIFKYTELTFEVDITTYMNDNRHKFIMNVLKSIGSNVEYLEQHHKKRRNYIIDVLKQMDLSNIKITETEELIKLYELLQNLKRIVIQKSLMRQLSKEEAQKLLKWHLEIIKNGVIAKEAI